MATGAYPSSMPAWEEEDLNSLSAKGLLSGVNPLVLAGIAQNESGFENNGPGINSIGDGGFFGLGENSTYSYGGQSFTETPSLLMNPGSAAFEQQAEASAADVARLLSEKGSLQGALQTYTGGSATNGDYEDAVKDLGGASVSSATSYPVSGTTGAAPSGTGTSSGSSSAVSLPWWLTVFGVSNDEVGGLVARALLVLVALILLAVGVDKLFSSSSPADIIVGAPGAVGGAASTASQTASSAVTGTPEPSRAPGANRERSGARSAARDLPLVAAG